MDTLGCVACKVVPFTLNMWVKVGYSDSTLYRLVWGSQTFLLSGRFLEIAIRK